MADTFHCPRSAGPDSPFVAPFNGEAAWRGDRTCSYCGSLDPELLFEQIDKGATLTPTDKSYKVYVDLVGHRVHGTGKFYFQHLSLEQKLRFLELWQERKLKMSEPFYVLPFFMRLDRNG